MSETFVLHHHYQVEDSVLIIGTKGLRLAYRDSRGWLEMPVSILFDDLHWISPLAQLKSNVYSFIIKGRSMEISETIQTFRIQIKINGLVAYELIMKGLIEADRKRMNMLGI